jgi:hypothetical protein
MTRITSKERFDDVAPENPDGTVDYTDRDSTTSSPLMSASFMFGRMTTSRALRPSLVPDARTRPEARALVEFITSTLGCTGIQFYCGPVGTYRGVDIRTLEFTET